MTPKSVLRAACLVVGVPLLAALWFGMLAVVVHFLTKYW